MFHQSVLDRIYLSQTRLQVNERSIKLLNATTLALGGEVIHLSDELETTEALVHAGFTLAIAFEDINRVIRGLNGLALHRLSPDVVRTNHMASALIDLRATMYKQGFILGITSFDEIFRCEVSHLVFKNGSMVIFLHLPAYQTETRLRLLEFLPVPLLLPKGSEDAEENGKSISMIPDPEQPLLAVTKDEGAFKALSRQELARCKNLAGTYFCGNSNLYDRRMDTACIIGLYRRNKQIITEHCHWRTNYQTDFTLQLDNNRFLLYLGKKDEVKLVCNGQQEKAISSTLQGMKVVTVPPLCRLYTRSFWLDGQSEFSLSLETFIEKTINFSELLHYNEFHNLKDLRNALTALQLVGSSAGLTIKNIRERFNGLNMGVSWDWGLRTGLSIMAVLVGALLFYQLYHRCIKRRRAAPQESPAFGGFTVNLKQMFDKGQDDPEQPPGRPLLDLGGGPEVEVPLEEAGRSQDPAILAADKAVLEVKERLLQAETHRQMIASASTRAKSTTAAAVAIIETEQEKDS